MSGRGIRTRIGAVATASLVGLGATLTTGPVAAHAAGPDPLAQYTDALLYSTPLPTFSDVRRQRPLPAELDWGSDGCSWSPDRPVGYNFLPGCHRHDFGYRNYKRQQRFTAASRRKIDANMKKDHYGTCGADFACRRIADLYYNAVRKFGGPSFAAARAALDAEIARQEAGRRGPG
ncbi:hypothetical protein GCM10010124_29130 [Pilimelia terevasa]|uniref:Phospholipase A2 n=1 Tax=Pilimelia terevasa TaxID=53372 RepID=A0A8J3BSN5_9ACTN|nr:phospholipase [Pilimelia terevasa]GGK34619.1 hypothetical protein GCM10010124_29130 [Pilimelia terevasa]